LVEEAAVGEVESECCDEVGEHPFYSKDLK